MSFGFGFGLPRAPLRGRPLGFDPASLFAQGEQGVWYDPSDFSTLFQDSGGTTPVTAVEQPVGLMLDKSKGLVLGPELVTNGDFSDGDTGWVVGTGWSIDAGVATFTPGISGNLDRNIGAVNGRFYAVSLTYTRSAGTLNIRVGSSGLNSVSLPSGSGATVTLILPSIGNDNYIRFNGSSTFAGTVDNISVRELPGNHAYQTTATSRPVLSARYNLLTKTEQFDDEVWAKTDVTVTPNAAVAPDGTLTAAAIVQASGTRTLNQDGPKRSIAVGGDRTISIYAKQNTARYLALGFSNGAGLTATALFDLQAGSVSGYGFHPSVCSSVVTSIESHGSGWYRCGFTLVGSTNVTNNYHFTSSTTGAIGLYNRDITGDGTSGIYIWGASLVPANQASLPYQRVNTATDYDSDPAKFPHYLRFDGVDDWMVTPTITPGTDKVQVLAGVRKLSDAAATIFESSTTANTNAGACNILSGNVGTGITYQSASRGTATISLQQAANIKNVGFSPDTAVIVATHDIAGDLSTIRRNGIAGTDGTGAKGTGNFLDYPLYIGRRAGTSLPFNGHLYGLLVRFGANLPIETIEKTEKYINQKTRAY